MLKQQSTKYFKQGDIMTLNNTNSAKKPLVEMPIKSEKEDLLETNDFQETLIRYIEESGTPVTIALQGEWGKGKTSMMNLVALRLCGKNFSISKSNAALPYHGVFINTWQFALSGGTPDQVTISILCSIINQLSELVPKEKSEKTKEALLNLAYNYGPEMLERIGSQLGRYSFISNIIAKTLIFIRNSKNKANKDPQIKQLKDSIKKLIDEILEKDNIKKGIIFFIDDLDRIDAELAVKILENFKNIFDFNHCIFVMAIDFDIIIKGLEPKLGKYSPSNSKKFEYYFAKFVQVSLPLPDPQDINDFITETTIAAGLFTKDEAYDIDFQSTYMPHLINVIEWSVGLNPRTIKQLAKKLEFVVAYKPDVITMGNLDNNDNTNNREQSNTIRYDINHDDIAMKTLFFILTCLQTSYPDVYRYLSYNSFFECWTDIEANSFNIPAITSDNTSDKERENLTKAPEWLRVLYRICLQDTFSMNHISDLTKIFSIMKDLELDLINKYKLSSPIAIALSKTSILQSDTPNTPLFIENVMTNKNQL